MLLLMIATFVRPSEVFTDIYGTQIYLVTMIIAAVASLPQIMRQLSLRELSGSPITVCVLGVLLAVPLSLLANRQIESAFYGLDAFARVVLFYLIVSGAQTSPARFSFFLGWTIFCIATLTVIGLLDFHEIYDWPLLTTRLTEGVEEVSSVDRLQYTGIFANPNGLSRLMVLAILVSIYFMTAPGAILLAPFWLALIGLFGHALMLTKSRGGLIGLLAGIAILFVSRFGLKRAIPFGLIALPVVMVMFGGGRQTDLSTDSGTGQDRIQLWQGGMEMFRASPIFGIGMDRYVEFMGLVAHNSFIHAYVELGFFGGMFFVGCYYFAFDRLLKLRKIKDQIGDPILRRALPYLIAILGAEAIGMLSISLSYALTTYMLLGTTAAFLRMVDRQPGIPAYPFDFKAAKRLVVVGVVVFVGFYVFIKFNIR